MKKNENLTGSLLQDASDRAIRYLDAIGNRAVAPSPDAIEHLSALGGSLPDESSDPAEVLRLLDEIGSPAIRIYYNFANALQSGRDLYAELRTLGKDRICQIHCTDQDGVWLEKNTRIDMQKVKLTLDEMDWSGWLVIERSRDASDSRNVRRNFGANAKYLKSVFQAN